MTQTSSESQASLFSGSHTLLLRGCFSWKKILTHKSVAICLSKTLAMIWFYALLWNVYIVFRYHSREDIHPTSQYAVFKLSGRPGFSYPLPASRWELPKNLARAFSFLSDCITVFVHFIEKSSRPNVMVVYGSFAFLTIWIRVYDSAAVYLLLWLNTEETNLKEKIFILSQGFRVFILGHRALLVLGRDEARIMVGRVLTDRKHKKGRTTGDTQTYFL